MTAIKRSGRSKSRQVGALPWRLDEREGVQVLLITSRGTRRWVIPKGGRMSGKTDAEAAAIEAIEEAGVVGRLSTEPIGRFRYKKVLSMMTSRMCVVSVLALRVSVQMGAWREDGERVRRWMSRDEAARSVSEPDLAALISGFRPEEEWAGLGRR